MTKSNDEITIYTDGGCDPNPGVGGWGAVLIHKNTRKELSGGDLETTNNRMELIAAISALEALKKSCSVQLYTDSQYVQKGITQWLPGWKRRGWRRKGGPILNLDLWKRLDELAQQHDIAWKWVRGHTGVPENERCDQLAEMEIRRQQSN